MIRLHAVRLCAVVAAALLPSVAHATIIDFESTPTGTYSSLPFAGVTITFTGGNHNFNVDDQTPGPPVSGHNLISFFANPGEDPFRATFSVSGIRSVQIGVGDFDGDEDDVHLAAFNSSNVLIGSDAGLIAAPTFGGLTLSVTTLSDIAYVQFWELGSFAGAVYWDNLTFDAAAPNNDVPEPGTLSLLGLGLLGAGALRRRKASAKTAAAGRRRRQGCTLSFLP